MSYDLIVQHRFWYASNRATDVSVNTFHFAADESLPARDAWESAVLQVKDFYNGEAQAGTSVASWLTPYRRTLPSSAEIRVYERVAPKPRVPVLVEPYNLSPASSAPNGSLPTECAVVLSYTAQRTSGIPVGRARGRLYLGPWRAGTLDPGSAGAPPVISSGLIVGALESAAARLMLGTENPESEPVQWSLWSETDQVMRPIIGGWIDNEFDTMRSRGLTYTARTPWDENTPL